MRLFIAVDIPDNLKQTLAQMQSGLDGVRWVTQAQMHLTLRFIGDIDDDKYDLLREKLAQIRFSAFDIALKGVGKFPHRGAPRILWVGTEAPPALGTLAFDIEQAVVSCGLAAADKPFSPHITLGRVKSAPPRTATERYFEKHGGYQSEPFTVHYFVLYSSDLQPTGAVYTPEAIFKST